MVQPLEQPISLASYKIGLTRMISGVALTRIRVPSAASTLRPRRSGNPSVDITTNFFRTSLFRRKSRV